MKQNDEMMNNPKLVVELVPKSCFFSNLRSNLKKKDWEKLRQLTIHNADDRCEICGSTGRGSSLECHEIWEYDDEIHLQRLIGLIALCKSCHQAKHMALARHMGWESAAERHLMRINSWDRKTLDRYLVEAFEVFESRSLESWRLDISWLVGFEIDLPDILDRENGS